MCPNCFSNLVNENYCTNCNRELIKVNNRILDKELYFNVKNVYEHINNFIENAVVTEKEIDDNMASQAFFNDLNTNKNNKTFILNQIDESLKSVNDFDNSIANFLNDKNALDVLYSMEDIFGDSNKLINSAKYHIDLLINKLNSYKKTIEENNEVVPDEAEIQKIYNQLDDFKESVLVVENEVNNVIHNQESLDLLRYDSKEREHIQNLIKNAYDSYDYIEENINDVLNDENKLSYFSFYDYKYGSIQDKMTDVLQLINNSREDIGKLVSFIDSVEKNIDNCKNSNDDNLTGRRVDL